MSKTHAVEQIIAFGFPDKWKTFSKNHIVFLKKLSALENLCNKVFARKFSSRQDWDEIVFALGRLCVEDFLEILLLSGNGYGTGAMKILRGMFERAVTAHYLSTHLNEAELFLDFHWVSQHKLLNAIKKTFQNLKLPQDKVAEVNAKYKEVRSKYERTKCRKCKTTEDGFSWNKKDLIALAGETNGLSDLIVFGYYFPMQEVHAGTQALIQRIHEKDKQLLEIGDANQSETADRALITAHNLILQVVDLQIKYFGLRAKRQWEQCGKDFQEIWEKPNGGKENHCGS